MSPLNKNKRPPRVPLACISLGPETRLYSEDFFLHELAPLGITRKGFRALLAALGVPSLEIGNTRLIDHLTLLIAFRSILRIGNPVFLAPGSLTLRKQRFLERYQTRLDPEYARAHLETILAELLTSRTVAPHSRMSRAALTRTIREAAATLASAGYTSLPLAAQSRTSLKALRRARKLPEFVHLTPDPGPTPPAPDGRG